MVQLRFKEKSKAKLPIRIKNNAKNIVYMYGDTISALQSIRNFLKKIHREYGSDFPFYVGKPLYYIDKDLFKILNKIGHKKNLLNKAYSI